MKIMKRNEIKRTVEEVVRVEYIAEDGQVFYNEEECLKYEESAKMTAFGMVKDKLLKRTNIYTLLREGHEDEDVEIWKVDSLETVELLNKYLRLCYRSSNKPTENPIKNDMVGKEVLVFWSYDRDWFIVHEDISAYLVEIRRRYEEIMTQE